MRIYRRNYGPRGPKQYKYIFRDNIFPSDILSAKGSSNRGLKDKREGKADGISTGSDRRSIRDAKGYPYGVNSGNPKALEMLDIEQAFIEEVKRRLEGTLIRYSARLELFNIAKSLGIDRFRANLLIAQTQLRAYKDPAVKEAIKAAGRSGTDTEDTYQGRFQDKLIFLGILFLFVAVVDFLIIKFVLN